MYFPYFQPLKVSTFEKPYLRLFFQMSFIIASEVNLNQDGLNVLNDDALARALHFKILRVEENCLAKTEFTPSLLVHSTVSIISHSGNIFQDREFQDLRAYEEFQERFTATRQKM